MIKSELLESHLFQSMPFGIGYYDLDDNFHSVNSVVHHHVFERECVREYVWKVFKEQEDKLGIQIEANADSFYFDFLHIKGESGELAGVLVLARSFKQFGELGEEYQLYKEMSMDLKAIFDSSYDVIYVSDGKGTTLRVSSACKELWGKDQKELIGKNVNELEEEGIYKPSITRLVLEQGKKISTIQTTRTGRRLMVVGTPIKDKEGNVERVVNASRDITEVHQLQSEIDELKQVMSGYKQELMELRKENSEKKQVVYQSQKMKEVTDLSRRVAQVDSTVLILGESGVGKEVIANLIHQSSQRSEKPFIKINCGAIPEALLESELFGYEKGSFTGAQKSGKMGLFESANGGTLFLDEIGELALPLQVKLLRVLQEQEVLRIGGTRPIKVNVRILAATNKELIDHIKKGHFREDLYYRLNVVPINIPPLRMRREDILPLVFYFMDYYNQKYVSSKTFSTKVLERLEQHDWPGNVRELQNIVERLIVISDGTDVSERFLPEVFAQRTAVEEKLQVLDIMPLKDCVELAESQLLKLAKERYKTTVEISKVLGVNQSTISRKLKKID